MLKRHLMVFAGDAREDLDIGVIVRSIETDEVIAVSYDAVAGVGEGGELTISVSIEGGAHDG